MAELFDCSSDNISLHLKNIYKEEELLEEATAEIFSVVQKEGNRDVKRNAKCYNLDAIIAVGYRVNSKKATKFRQWATKTLKEYITKGFVLNDDMLKNGKPFGKDYFDELLERIREIRASERRAYQKITDVFEQCSYDYDKNSEITRAFYAFVQNYLNEKELSRLNRLVTMFIDYAELMAEDEILMSMQDWVVQTNQFLSNNRRKVLDGKGKISHEQAVGKAAKEYDIFRVRQDQEYVSEFDKQTEKYFKGD